MATRGLRRPPPELIAKARDDTAAQVNRVFLTLIGTAAFCLLSLLTPDSSLLAGNDKISVPFAGPVSFLGFMLLGPAVLISLRIYLQFYVEHERRLDRIARGMSAARAPTLAPDKNPLMRAFIGFAFYLLLPLVILAFFWKAAVFRYWGTALLVVAAAVIAMHLLLLLRSLSWRRRTILSLGAAILAAGVMMSFGPWHRPFYLFRANLSDQWLTGVELKDAKLAYANLNNAYLDGANLSGADLSSANVSGAHFFQANLSGADLSSANVSGARLVQANLNSAQLVIANLNNATLAGANLSRADLSGANLSSADLVQANLNSAKLFIADLIGANLSGADLSGADLSGADLIGANLSGADFNRAKLSNADLSGAKVAEVRGLTQEQLDTACGKQTTVLPPGLTLLRICSDKKP